MAPLPAALITLVTGSAVLGAATLAPLPGPAPDSRPAAVTGAGAMQGRSDGAAAPGADPRSGAAASGAGTSTRTPPGRAGTSPADAGRSGGGPAGADRSRTGPAGAVGGTADPVPGAAISAGTGSGARPGYGWPLPGTPSVLRRFVIGPQPWSPGHRGVDLGGDGNVLAAGAGTVTFAGSVAGRGVVVVNHADGLRTTYEPVRPAVRTGQLVARGDRLGTLDPLARHCSGTDCLHWGALSGTAYLDPLTLVSGARRPPVLLPLSTAGLG